MGMIALSYAGLTHPGKVREANEDSIRVDPARGFAMVADGVGGAKGGATASAMTVEIVQRAMAEELDRLMTQPGVDEVTARERLAAQVQRALASASLAVHTRGRGERELKGMATTSVVAQIVGNWAVVAHVGDSRVYLVRGGVCYQLTEDHSLARDLLARGAITAADADNYVHNVIVRAVGMQPTVAADLVTFELAPDDVLVLCSDGLTDVVSADEIRQAVLSLAPEAAAAALIDRANAGGGPDNISVALVRVSSAAPPARASMEQQIGMLRHIALFRELTFQEAARVLACTRERRVAANDVVFREGDPGDRFYLVTDGAVVVSQRGTGLTTIESGGHFGELALITDAVRSATVHAVRPTTLLAIDRDAFVQLVRQDHALAVKLLWGLLRFLGERVKDLSSQVSWITRCRRRRRSSSRCAAGCPRSPAPRRCSRSRPCSSSSSGCPVARRTSSARWRRCSRSAARSRRSTCSPTRAGPWSSVTTRSSCRARRCAAAAASGSATPTSPSSGWATPAPRP